MLNLRLCQKLLAFCLSLQFITFWLRRRGLNIWERRQCGDRGWDVCTSYLSFFSTCYFFFSTPKVSKLQQNLQFFSWNVLILHISVPFSPKCTIFPLKCAHFGYNMNLSPHGIIFLHMHRWWCWWQIWGVGMWPFFTRQTTSCVENWATTDRDVGYQIIAHRRWSGQGGHGTWNWRQRKRCQKYGRKDGKKGWEIEVGGLRLRTGFPPKQQLVTLQLAGEHPPVASRPPPWKELTIFTLTF